MYSFYGGKKGEDFLVSKIFESLQEMLNELSTNTFFITEADNNPVLISYGKPNTKEFNDNQTKDLFYGNYHAALFQKVNFQIDGSYTKLSGDVFENLAQELEYIQQERYNTDYVYVSDSNSNNAHNRLYRLIEGQPNPSYPIAYFPYGSNFGVGYEFITIFTAYTEIDAKIGDTNSASVPAVAVEQNSLVFEFPELHVTEDNLKIGDYYLNKTSKVLYRKESQGNVEIARLGDNIEILEEKTIPLLPYDKEGNPTAPSFVKDNESGKYVFKSPVYPKFDFTSNNDDLVNITEQLVDNGDNSQTIKVHLEFEKLFNSLQFSIDAYYPSVLDITAYLNSSSDISASPDSALKSYLDFKVNEFFYSSGNEPNNYTVILIYVSYTKNQEKNYSSFLGQLDNNRNWNYFEIPNLNPTQFGIANSAIYNSMTTVYSTDYINKKLAWKNYDEDSYVDDENGVTISYDSGDIGDQLYINNQEGEE